jgi:hypothetical protein
MFCGLAECSVVARYALWSPDTHCSGQICAVVARNDIQPLFHTQNTHSIMILDVLSDLSVLW